MPQMMPLNWLLLFTMFILIFLIFNSFIYFNFLYPIKKINFNKKKMQTSWKW